MNSCKKCKIFFVLLLILSLLIVQPNYINVYADSVGTADNPYLITTASEFNNIRNNLSAYYKLGNDIDLSSYNEWTPIGDKDNLFEGNLDGNGKIISNLNITKKTTDNTGLFGVVGSGGKVSELGIDNASIIAENYVGVLAGKNSGTIEKVYAKGSITADENVGGLVGENNGCIQNTYASVNISGKVNVGGLVGNNTSEVINSYTTSRITTLFNNYLSFDGIDDYVSIPHNEAYETDTFTLESWFKWDDFNTNNVDFIVSKGLNQFEIHTGGGPSMKNGIRFIPMSPSTEADSWLDDYNAIGDNWFHVAATLEDNKDNTYTARLYINGVPQELNVNCSTDNPQYEIILNRESSPCSGNTNELRIGKRSDGSSSFSGKINEVRFWNVARTKDEIKENMNKELRGDEAGLVGYWKLDEGNGTIATDSSSIGNNGTTEGGTWVTSSSDTIGGLIGVNSGTVTKSFYDKDVLGQTPDSDKGTPKTTDEMKDYDLYSSDWDIKANFDEESIWKLSSDYSNNGYPMLSCEVTKVINVTSQTPDGSYKEGDTIDIDVEFNGEVTVSGTPTLSLETGDTDRKANYISGSNSNVLKFRYTVNLTDNSSDLEYTDTTALELNGGSIEYNNSDVVLMLPAPGTENSLSSNKDIEIVSATPIVTIASTKTSPTNSSPIPVTVTFNKNVIDFTISDIVVGNGNTSNFTGSGKDYSIDITPINDGTITVDVPKEVCQDTEGNNNIAAEQFQIEYDGTNPAISSLTPVNGSTSAGINDNLVIEFNEKVKIGTGNITIKKVSDDGIVEEIAVNSGQVTGGGTDTIEINPSVTLEREVGYYVEIAETAFDDNAGNSFAGIGDKNIWNFTTEDKVLSSDADLTNITIYSGTLSPAFSKDKILYRVDVGYSVTDIKIKTITSAITAKVKVDGEDLNSGQISENILLNVGENRIRIIVTAEDNTSKTYTVLVNRAEKTSKEDKDKDEDKDEAKINEETEEMIEEKIEEKNGVKSVKVKVNNTVLEEKINDIISKQEEETEKDNKLVEISVSNKDADEVETALTGDIVKKMEDKDFKVAIKNNDIEYIIPAKEMEIENVADILGVQKEELKDIEIDVKIKKIDKVMAEEIAKKAQKEEYEIIFPPVEFTIKAKTTYSSGEEKETNISEFSTYVERIMEIPQGVDPNKITTGIVYNPDGTFSHIPTKVFQKNGKYYAKLNSLTNSNYSVIYNPINVKSVENHWSKEIVNDMASRLIIKNPESFNPDENISRGEFAEYITKALGLYRTGIDKENEFLDVDVEDEFADAIEIAVKYGIIKGYPDGSFKPSASITREEAMTMYARAMDVAKLEEVDNELIESYKDKGIVSIWAYDSVKKTISVGIFKGRTEDKIVPKGAFTYAEAATAIRNLLTKTNLINE